MHERQILIECEDMCAAASNVDFCAPCRVTSQTDGQFSEVPAHVLQSTGSRVLLQSSWAWGDTRSIPFFRTGDLGRLGPNGLDIFGRIDSQVKVGGVYTSHSAYFRTHLLLSAQCPVRNLLPD